MQDIKILMVREEKVRSHEPHTLHSCGIYILSGAVQLYINVLYSFYFRIILYSGCISYEIYCFMTISNRDLGFFYCLTWFNTRDFFNRWLWYIYKKCFKHWKDLK